MELHWILLFVAVILVGLIAWHSTRFSTSALRKVFERRTKEEDTDSALGLDLSDEDDLFSQPSSQKKSQNNGVICLNIKAPEGEAFVGTSLVEIFRKANLYLGDLNIFHYEVERDGDYYPVFSLASAFEPGTFDMNTINDYVTPGLTLFMETDGENSPAEIFDLMLETAKNLADDLQGILCDDKWLPLTDSSLQQYVARL